VKIKLLSILIFFCLISFSQDLRIQGKVTFEKSESDKLAEVIVSKQDSLLNSTVLEEDGFFVFSHLSPGNYTIEVKHWGKIVYAKNWDLKEDIDLGEIKVAVEKEIQQVTVTGNKKLIERKVDRMVFNVENSIVSSSGTVLNVLKKTPKVKIEDPNIKIIGKSLTKIMIDNRLIELSGESLINYLQSISSDQIKSVEVITNPPSKYDSEGNSGLINILLKKAKKNSWNLSFQSNLTQSHHTFSNQGADFNFNKNKLSLSLNLFNNFMFYDFTNHIHYYYPDGLWKNNYKGTDKSRKPSFRANLDYNLNKQITLGGNYSYSQTNNIGNRMSLAELEGNKAYNTIFTPTFKKDHSQIHTANFHILYKMDSLGRQLTLDMNYLNYNTRPHSRFYSRYSLDNQFVNQTDAIKNNLDQKLKNYSTSLDMEHPFSKIKFNYGGKISFNRVDNQISYYTIDIKNNSVPDSTNSNHFKYQENTESIYMTISKDITNKWKAQLGIRTEFTQVKGNSKTLQQINKNNYGKLFPTAYLSYTNNEESVISLNYGRRIHRPKFTVLNPFKQYLTPYSYITGNPDLKPYYTHNLELNYDYKDLTLSLSYSRTKNEYTDVTLLNNMDKTQVSTQLNAVNSIISSLDISYIFSGIHGWESINEMNIQYSEYKSDNLQIGRIRNIGWLFYFSTDNSFYLDKNKNFIFNINWNYNSKGIDELSRINSYQSLDLSFRMFFVNKKLQITLTGEDIFQTNKPKYTDFTNSIKQTYSWYGDTNHFFQISIVYKLGNSKLNMKKIKSGNEEEKERIH
jgi:hypothetical protein